MMYVVRNLLFKKFRTTYNIVLLLFFLNTCKFSRTRGKLCVEVRCTRNLKEGRFCHESFDLEK